MASWISAAISFFVTPVFTRLYSPGEVGHINMFMTYMTFFQTLCVLSLDQAFMRFFNEPPKGINKGNFLTYCLRINFFASLVSAAAILAGYRFFSDQISGSVNIYVPICLVTVSICGMFLRMTSISSRMEGKVSVYTFQVVSIAVIEKVLCTLIAFYRPSHLYAIGIISVSYVITSAALFFIKRKASLRPARGVPRETLKLILRFAVPYLPVLLFAWLNGSIPLLVLKRYVDYSAIGIYTNAVTIANILTIVQTGFTTYWGPFIYENYKINRDKVIKVERCIVLVLLLLAMGIVLFQDVIYLLIGEKFRSSKSFFPFLMMSPICGLIADMTGIGIMLSKKTYLNIYSFLASVSVNLTAAILLSRQIGVDGAAIAVAMAACVMLLIRTIMGSKYYRVSNNNWFIYTSLAVFAAVAVSNLVWADQIILRSLFTVLAMLVLVAIFRKEVVYLFKFGVDTLKKRK